jgi:hypothetical protein
MTCQIFKDGHAIQRSSNLRGIRQYVGQNLVDHVEIKQRDTHLGMLYIVFDNGATFETLFASFTVLKTTVANWRNLYGAPLKINGTERGRVSYSNAALRS